VACVATGVALALVLGACGGETQVSSSTVSTTTPTETIARRTTVPLETTPATTEPPAIAAPPTTTPVTTVPATTTPPATAAPPTSAPADTVPATAFVTADEALIEVDTTTGTTVRVLQEIFSGDGVFRGGLRLSPDGSTIWFSEGYEDGWYGCDSSIGSFGRIDAATGEVEVLGVGGGVEPSAHGE
jgi:streptogramin lyase